MARLLESALQSMGMPLCWEVVSGQHGNMSEYADTVYIHACNLACMHTCVYVRAVYVRALTRVLFCVSF